MTEKQGEFSGGCISTAVDSLKENEFGIEEEEERNRLF